MGTTDNNESLEQYSYSKLSTWNKCQYSYYLRYIKGLKGISNAFAEYGTFVHGLLEDYANGDAKLEDLPSLYEWGYDAAVTTPFPHFVMDLNALYHKQGLAFLWDFKGYDKYEILGVEKEFLHKIDDWNLYGFIDLLFRDEDGRLIVRDYKSKGEFKSKAELAEYARQLYLYSAWVKEEYGTFPDELQFLMFRKNNLIKLPFDLQKYNEAVDWARHTVAEIREAFYYPPCDTDCKDFYAENLCNHRQYCQFCEFATEEEPAEVSNDSTDSGRKEDVSSE